MKISYNWLQNYFEEKLPEPGAVAEGIIFHSFEVEDTEVKRNDTIFDVKVLPDRNHDCLSHWGIAKEISAIFDLKIKEREYKNFEDKSTNLEIKIEDDKCLRYMGRIVRNVKVGQSPDWLKESLNAIGQKSINNIVDAANFVMFDLGQPIHCFDLDKLESEKLIIRNGKTGEKITTLDKKEIDLDDSILVIADETNPLAIAGIKGGTKAEVDKDTKNIVIEVANFNPITTRKTSKKINILTDAVKRYENELTPELCSLVMDSITDLIYKLAGGEVENFVDIYPKKPEQNIIKISVEYINKRLGSDFSKDEIESVWNKLNFKNSSDGNEFEIIVPYLRLDLTGPHDLTEEVIRIIGYDRLPEKLPEINLETKVNDTYYKMLFTRNKLLLDGYSEVMTYVFRDKGEVEVLASASGKNFLRNNIEDGLKESIKLNILNMPLLGVDNIKVFEIGTVFLKRGEEMHVAYGDKKGVTEVTLNEFFDKNASREEKESMSLEKFISFVSSNENNKIEPFKIWSIYPFISRDIAVWVLLGADENELVKIYKEIGGELLVREPKKFDEFTKGDKTSYAFCLVFQSYKKTLKDEEINQIMEKINEKISSFGWDVR